MTPEAQKILTMIEGVTAQILEALEGRGYEDVDKWTVVNEINGRVHCLINKVEYISCGELRSYGFEQRVTFLDANGDEQNELCEDYVESIDAQEALRREGWGIDVCGQDGFGFNCYICKVDEEQETNPINLPTEPLARLHAWVQVWGMT